MATQRQRARRQGRRKEAAQVAENRRRNSAQPEQDAQPILAGEKEVTGASKAHDDSYYDEPIHDPDYVVIASAEVAERRLFALRHPRFMRLLDKAMWLSPVSLGSVILINTFLPQYGRQTALIGMGVSVLGMLIIMTDLLLGYRELNWLRVGFLMLFYGSITLGLGVYAQFGLVPALVAGGITAMCGVTLLIIDGFV